MSLTTNVRNKLLDAINMAFSAIGVSADTKMPRAPRGDNTSPVAWEYFVASHILALARGRYEAAKRAAIAVGIIFDHEKHPREPGASGQIYAGEHVTIWLTVRKPALRVDVDEMAEYLIRKGVDTQLVVDARTHATHASRPAHEFKASLIAANGENK